MRYAIAIGIAVITIVVTSSYRRSTSEYYNKYSKTVFQPDTGYYNLLGKPIDLKITDTGDGIKIILTYSMNKDTLMDLYLKRRTIVLPDKSLMDTIIKCFRKTDIRNNKDSFEFGFAVGKAGKLSHIVQGKVKEFTRENRKECVEALKVKNDLLAYEVHSHPHGSPIASREDSNVYKPSCIQPCYVLGYENFDGLRWVEYVGFYDQKDRGIASIKFSQFLTIIDNINKDVDLRKIKD